MPLESEEQLRPPVGNVPVESFPNGQAEKLPEKGRRARVARRIAAVEEANERIAKLCFQDLAVGRRRRRSGCRLETPEKKRPLCGGGGGVDFSADFAGEAGCAPPPHIRPQKFRQCLEEGKRLRKGLVQEAIEEPKSIGKELAGACSLDGRGVVDQATCQKGQIGHELPRRALPAVSGKELLQEARHLRCAGSKERGVAGKKKELECRLRRMRQESREERSGGTLCRKGVGIRPHVFLPKSACRSVKSRIRNRGCKENPAAHNFAPADLLGSDRRRKVVESGSAGSDGAAISRHLSQGMEETPQSCRRTGEELSAGKSSARMPTSISTPSGRSAE